MAFDGMYVELMEYKNSSLYTRQSKQILQYPYLVVLYTYEIMILVRNSKPTSRWQLKCERLASIRRINATPLDIKAGNWMPDTREISLYSVSIYSSPRISD